MLCNRFIFFLIYSNINHINTKFDSSIRQSKVSFKLLRKGESRSASRVEYQYFNVDRVLRSEFVHLFHFEQMKLRRLPQHHFPLRSNKKKLLCVTHMKEYAFKASLLFQSHS